MKIEIDAELLSSLCEATGELVDIAKEHSKNMIGKMEECQRIAIWDTIEDAERCLEATYKLF